jgi:L-malate glycosyltransferase
MKPTVPSPSTPSAPRHITFWLPGACPRPIGGVRVVYELANRLSARGQNVTVAHILRPDKHLGTQGLLRAWCQYISRRWLGRDQGFRVDAWCAVYPDVNVRGVIKPRLLHAGNPSWQVATAWQTAEWLKDFAANGSPCAYLIQNDERRFDDADPARVEATWRLPAIKCVTGTWLSDLLAEHRETSNVIGQGVDYQASPHYHRHSPTAKKPGSIMMLAHPSKWKRTASGIEAIRRAEALSGPLTVTLFGTDPRPANLPSHWHYLENPAQDALATQLGETELFVSPSEVEGFALPPCEAMLAGCACVLTDIGGHRDAGIAEKTALLTPLGDDNALAAAIIRLRENHSLRAQLATQGQAHVRAFHWADVTTRFEAVLEANVFHARASK